MKGRWLAWSLALFLVVLGAKFTLIDRYGSDLPFWDQWDAEGEYLYRPYLEGKLAFRDLFNPHNEHRPFFTRLTGLALLEANDRQWDGRLQATFNALLHTGLALLLFAFARRVLPPLAAAGYAVLIGLFFSTAMSWENTLVGFQSQFYFLLLFTLLHLGATLLPRPRSWMWWLAPLFGLAALFSMASGLLSAAAIVAVVIARAGRERKLAPGDAWVLGINGALVAAGLVAKEYVANHVALRPSDPAVALQTFLHQFSWPACSLWAAPFGLLAPVAMTIAFFRRRLQGPVATVLFAACIWVTLQALATTYARGADGQGYASRYNDTLAVAVLLHALSLAYLAVTAADSRRRQWWTILTASFVALSIWGLSREAATAQDFIARELPRVNDGRIAAVASYVENRDPAFLKREPWYEIPYPSAARLAELLDSRAIQAILPASVRPAISLEADPGQTSGFAVRPPQPELPPPPTRGGAVWFSEPAARARFTSSPFRVDHSRVSLFVMGNAEGHSALALIDERGETLRPLGPVVTQARWKRINFAVNPGMYRLQVEHRDGGWMGFTSPRTNTSLSVLVVKVLAWGPWLCGAGAVLALVGLWLLPIAPLVLRPPPTAPAPRTEAGFAWGAAWRAWSAQVETWHARLCSRPYARWGMGLLVALGFVLLAGRQHLLVDRYAVNAMYLDQWDFFTPFFQDAGWWDIFDRQHGPHRQGLGFLVTRVLAEISHWNSRVDAFAVSGALMAAAAVGIVVARRCGVRGIALLAVPLLFFNLRQYEIFVGASNLSHGAMPVLLLCLYAWSWFVPRRGLRLALLGLLTFFLIFTGFGIFVGLVTPLLVAIESIHAIRARDRAALIPCVAALIGVGLSWGLFAKNYYFAPAVPGFHFPHERPLEYFSFAGLMLDNFFGVPGHGAASVAFGLLLLLGLTGLTGWAGWRVLKRGVTDDVRSTLIFALGLFALLYCANTAVGRVCLGLTNAPAASRYVPLLIPAGLAVLLATSLLPRAAFRAAAGLAIASLLAAGTLRLRPDDWASIRWYSEGRQRWLAAYARSHDIARANQEAGFEIHPVPDAIAERMDYLKRHRLNLFADPALATGTEARKP